MPKASVEGAENDADADRCTGFDRDDEASSDSGLSTRNQGPQQHRGTTRLQPVVMNGDARNLDDIGLNFSFPARSAILVW
jgi:hypothetical protein